MPGIRIGLTMLVLGLNLGFAAQALAQHNSRNSLDWAGTYQGLLPCADCEGIATRITLLRNGEFIRQTQHVGKTDGPRSDRGSFTWDDAGGRITLTSDGAEPQMFQVGENVLFQLDRDGRRITGDLAAGYRLVRNFSDLRLEGRQWLLTELLGEPVDPVEDQSRPTLQFDSALGMLSGSDGCNSFSGPYEVSGNGSLHIGHIATTMMACPETTAGRAFTQTLQTASDYHIVDDVLFLFREPGLVIARFEVASK